MKWYKIPDIKKTDQPFIKKIKIATIKTTSN